MIRPQVTQRQVNNRKRAVIRLAKHGIGGNRLPKLNPALSWKTNLATHQATNATYRLKIGTIVQFKSIEKIVVRVADLDTVLNSDVKLGDSFDLITT